MSAPDPREVYANLLEVHGGPFDVLLDFGQRLPGVEGPLQAEERVARVRTSWAHLKSMLPALSAMVAAYEREHGVIPAPGFFDEPDVH